MYMRQSNYTRVVGDPFYPAARRRRDGPFVFTRVVGDGYKQERAALQSKNAAIASATSWFVGVGQSRTTFGSASIVMRL